MGRRKNGNAEQIVASLSQIDVQFAQGRGVVLACKEAEISEQGSWIAAAPYTWRRANELGERRQRTTSSPASDPLRESLETAAATLRGGISLIIRHDDRSLGRIRLTPSERFRRSAPWHYSHRRTRAL